MPSNLNIPISTQLAFKKCISADGDRLLNKIETGRIDDCSLLKQTTFMLIKYLMTKVDPDPLECLIPCDVVYSSNMTHATHNYLNKFIIFADKHCRYCK